MASFQASLPSSISSSSSSIRAVYDSLKRSSKPPSTRRSLTVMPNAVDRKSTRLNSSHANISYAVFCLKKKKRKPSVKHIHIYPQWFHYPYITTLYARHSTHSYELTSLHYLVLRRRLTHQYHNDRL